MERLYQKASVAAALVMITFALIVSVSKDGPDTLNPENKVAREDSSSNLIRPLARSSEMEEPNRFEANSLIPISTTHSPAIQQVQGNLDDLPELDLEAANQPRKLIQPFQGLQPLPKDIGIGPMSSATTQSPQIQQSGIQPVQTQQPKTQKPKQIQTRHVNIAPAIVQTFLQKVHYANSLARRGAVSSAKAELFLAMRLLAEAIDQLKNTQLHSSSLKAALTALEEMEDFSSWGHDLSVFVDGHSTEVLKNADLSQVSVNDARFAYLNLVEEKLLDSCQRLSIAAEAFRSLGKVYSMVDHFASDQAEMTAAKSMLMFKLATTVNSRDAAAANDLAVMYAKYNHLAEAKKLLVGSLQVRNESSTWSNLAKVHQALGEGFLAKQAMNEARMAASKNQQTQRVLWTNPANFNRVQSMVDPPAMTVDNSRAQTPANFRQPNSRR